MIILSKNFIKVLLILFLCSLVQINSEKCVNGTLLQNSTQYPGSYCGALINWKITETTLNNYKTHDEQALTEYTSLYNKWKEEGEGSGKSTYDGPKNDCLGIARVVFCAWSYPYCEDDKEDPAVCEFVCDLWIERCKNEDKTYDKICKSIRDKKCQFAKLQLTFQMSIFLMIFIMIIL